VPHIFPPVEVLKFRLSNPIIVPLLCGLENYGIASFALPAGRFFIVDLIEQGHLLVVGGSVFFYILWSSLTVHIAGAVVGVSYDTSELCFRFDVVFDAIHGMHQPSMNLKTQFVSMT
jgi:hypothetical protein